MSEKISRHLSFTVFKVAQIEELLKEKMCETVIPEDGEYLCRGNLGGYSSGWRLAGYIPSKTYIALPPAAAFKRMEGYYAELSTGFD
jgi:antirestriction protein ArdC